MEIHRASSYEKGTGVVDIYGKGLLRAQLLRKGAPFGISCEGPDQKDIAFLLFGALSSGKSIHLSSNSAK